MQVVDRFFIVDDCFLKGFMAAARTEKTLACSNIVEKISPFAEFELKFYDIKILKEEKRWFNHKVVKTNMTRGVEEVDEHFLVDHGILVGLTATGKVQKSLIMPKVVDEIGANVFANNNNIESVEMHGKIKYIGKNAFQSCAKLAHVNLPDSLQCIDEFAFARCGNLRAIVIPESVIYIGQQAFSECRALRAFKIPAKVKQIEKFTFFSCKELGNVNLTNVEIIKEGAFTGTNLKKILIPKTVEEINNFAFNNCINLESVTMPKSVKIGRYSFLKCPKLLRGDVSDCINKSEKSMSESVYAENEKQE